MSSDVTERPKDDRRKRPKDDRMTRIRCSPEETPKTIFQVFSLHSDTRQE